MDETPASESGNTHQPDNPSPQKNPDESTGKVLRWWFRTLEKILAPVEGIDTRLRWSEFYERYKKTSLAGLFGILFVIVCFLWTTFSLTDKVLKFVFGPSPSFDGQASFSIAHDGSSGSTYDLVYKLVVTLSNTGDELKGGGALVVLRAENDQFIPIALDSEQPVINKPGLTASWPYNLRITQRDIPNYLLACIWQKSGGREFPVVFHLSQQEVTNTTMGNTPLHIAYAPYQVVPDLPENNDKSKVCHDKAGSENRVSNIRVQPFVTKLIKSDEDDPITFGVKQSQLNMSAFHPPINGSTTAVWQMIVQFPSPMPAEFFKASTKYILDAKEYDTIGQLQPIGLVFTVPNASGKTRITLSYEVPGKSAPYRRDYDFDFTASAEEYLKHQLLSMPAWFVCNDYLRKHCDYRILNALPAIKEIRYGGSRDLNHRSTIEIKQPIDLNTDYKIDAASWGVKPLDLDATWNSVFVQLLFANNSESDIREIPIWRSGNSQNRH